MDALTSPVEEIVFIQDDEALKPKAVGRWHVALWLAWTGLTVVVALVTAVPVADAIGASRREQCAARLKLLARALNEYHEAHGHFPAPVLAGRDGTPLLSWRVAILPQLGYGSLFERFHLDEPWDSPHNRALLEEMPAEFACPSGPGRRAAKTGYLVVVGPATEYGSVNTPFEPTRGVDLREITDGTSNTILVMESNSLVPWTKPEDLHWVRGGPLPPVSSPHQGGTHVLFADGSARFIKPTVSPNILAALLTINGGEVLSGSS